MLYIHQLNHLTPRMADLESVYLVRELKSKTPYPFQKEQLASLFRDFLVANEKIVLVEESVSLIETAVEQIKDLLQKQSPLYETINLQRAIQMLRSFPPFLQNNLLFLQEFQIWQRSSVEDIANLFNRIPQLRSMEEKIKANEEIKKIFSFLLRNPEFFFNYHDVVNEGQVATAQGLLEGMEKGFFFHVTLEEATKRLEYGELKRRIPHDELLVVEKIGRDIQGIKNAIDTAYASNMSIVNLSVILYAYVKWLTGK